MPSLDNIAKEVSSNTGLQVQLIINTYKSFWRFIKENIEALPLKEDLSEEDFEGYKKNFNLPYLGKLYCNFEDWEKIKKKNNDRHQYKED